MGFGVWGLGFRVWGLGFGVWGLGFGVWGLEFRVYSGFMVSSSELWVWSSGCTYQAQRGGRTRGHAPSRTLHPTPPHPTPCALRPQPQPYTSGPGHQASSPTPQTRNHQHQMLNHKTRAPQHHMLDPTPQVECPHPSREKKRLKKGTGPVTSSPELHSPNTQPQTSNAQPQNPGP